MYLMLFNQLDVHNSDGINHPVLMTVSDKIIKYLQFRVMTLLRDLWPSQDCWEPKGVKDDSPA